MNRVVRATVVALCSLALLQPASHALPSVSDLSSSSSRATNDTWLKGYNALPPQVRDAVPPHLRPAQPAPLPAPPTEPEYEAAPEPTPAPDTCANCVAITFDDGPGAYTGRLLDILDEKDAKATFFVVGQNANANPALMQRMRDSGHTIANHTYNHPDLKKQSDATITKQLDDTNAAIANTTGVKPKWMRPPYGSYDNRTVVAAGERGQAVAIWDVDTADWQHRNPTRTCNLAVQNSTPGSIILMHDIHAPTVDAVPCVIDGLRAKGLRPVSLEYMVKQSEPGRVYTRRP